jgi:Skp family chaperone for outer membrane proteins
MFMRAAVVLAAIIGGAAPSLAAQGTCPGGQVAVVQVQLILGGIPRYAQKDSDLTVVASDYRTQLARQEAILDSATNAYQTKAAVLGASARAIELAKLRGQDSSVRAQSQRMQDQLGHERQLRLQPIELGVQTVLDSVRADLHCALVFDAGSSQGIASLNRSIDLTQMVLDRINAHGDTALFGPHPALPGARKP